jgi:hypothetical protein
MLNKTFRLVGLEYDLFPFEGREIVTTKKPEYHSGLFDTL